ncbi:MAG: hypothetical protein COV66_02255 [Nitrospinae bacterium CG11_big_fil_rev_8_21_14_0_20_45_15]|nr:MAG: hypothetical protein COV66_02255 [Nitrospinae bacterium CG11_big_fil_rev_8_21_14_0_20_45_15]
MFCWFGISACGTTGHKFDESQFGAIVNGETRQAEVLQLLGDPYQKGVENGSAVWIYEYNRFNLFGNGTSKDLYIVFDDKGTVESHQFMSN